MRSDQAPWKIAESATHGIIQEGATQGRRGISMVAMRGVWDAILRRKRKRIEAWVVGEGKSGQRAVWSGQLLIRGSGSGSGDGA